MVENEKSILLISRKVLQNLIPKKAAINVGIDFGCTDAFVSQHGLNGAQVGSALQQVGGKTVSEGVGRDGLLDARLFGVDLDIMEYSDARQVLLARRTDKDVIFFARFDVDGIAESEPRL